MNRPAGRVRLSAFDRALLAGEEGAAPQLAMRILTRMAEVRGVDAMLDIEAAHIDSTIYVGDAGLEFAERLAGLGARVRVPSTLNVSGLDEQHWREWSVPEDWADKSARQMRAYASMGTIPTWTCAPYQDRQTPRFGQQIAWGESNAVCFANSVIGARTERYPDLLDICCAITGRAPAAGLHLDENRLATRVLSLREIPEEPRGARRLLPGAGAPAGPLRRGRPRRHRGAAGAARGGPAQGAGRRRRLIGSGGALPHSRRHPRGAPPCATRWAAALRSRRARWGWPNCGQRDGNSRAAARGLSTWSCSGARTFRSPSSGGSPRCCASAGAGGSPPDRSVIS